MLKPMMRKVALGVPAVALTAALAFTMAGCGGGAEEQKKASDDTATTQPAEEPKAEEAPEPAVEAKTGVDYPSYSLEPTDGWKPGTRSMNEKYEECEFTLGDDTYSSEIVFAETTLLGEMRIAPTEPIFGVLT